MKNKESFDWDRPHGVSVEFLIDGRIQINGEAGLYNYLMGNVLVNPHLTLHYKLPDSEKTETIARVSNEIPHIPNPTPPHPHTMKLGEFIAHSHLFGRLKLSAWLKKGFSRVTENVLQSLVKEGKVPKPFLNKNLDSMNEADFKIVFQGLQKVNLMAPSTSTVLAIGEKALAKSINRLGETDFFSVNSRRPTICDFKPVQVEVAVARVKASTGDAEEPVQVLRFANRVPLQFDKAGCAIVQAINSIRWKTYGLSQPKGSLPRGPYTIAVSVVSPFIKFKNASKETIDSSEELVQEIRLALIQAGQRLSRHIKREHKEEELEKKKKYIEQFGPILVDGLVRIIDAGPRRKAKAEAGLDKILGRDEKASQKELKEAHSKLEIHLEKQKARLGLEDDDESDDSESAAETSDVGPDQKDLFGDDGSASKKIAKKTKSKKN